MVAPLEDATVAGGIADGFPGKLMDNFWISGVTTDIFEVLTVFQSSCKIPPVSPESGFQAQKVQLIPLLLK